MSILRLSRPPDPTPGSEDRSSPERIQRRVLSGVLVGLAMIPLAMGVILSPWFLALAVPLLMVNGGLIVWGYRIERRQGRGRPHSRVATILLAAGTIWLVLAPFALAQDTMGPEYRDVAYIGSRNLIWIVAQLHLLLGGFVLGVPIFALVCEIVGYRSGDQRYDILAKEFTKLLIAAFGTTATFGAILLFFLLGLYPRLVNHLAGVFFPTYVFYAFLFLAETVTLYIYWYGWSAMAGRKLLHIGLGVLLNIWGVLILMTADAWLTYQASPVVLAEGMGYWERLWAAIHNPTWGPVNIHRLIGNIVLGGFICGAYAGVRYLGATTAEERAHYDWMGYVGNFVGIFALLPLPFAGYWLMREIYQYNQQMGITLMGGILSWLFILQAIQIGVLFMGANYYFWQGIAHRTTAPARYQRYIAVMLVILLVCFGIWLTPHSLVMSLEEARQIGGAHHPLLGVFGVMSAKMTVVNLMILTTFVSFLLYWRANKEETVRWARAAKVVQIVIVAVAAIVIIWLGVYGYYVPAIVRVNVLSVVQVLVVLFVMAVLTPLTAIMMRSARMTGHMRWGNMPPRSQYALILNGVMIILLMTLMGYARSASRLHWHVYGVLRDTSPYAFTPALGQASLFMVGITFAFCLIVSFIFWVAGLAEKGSSGHGLQASPASPSSPGQAGQ